MHAVHRACRDHQRRTGIRRGDERHEVLSARDGTDASGVPGRSCAGAAARAQPRRRDAGSQVAATLASGRAAPRAGGSVKTPGGQSLSLEAGVSAQEQTVCAPGRAKSFIASFENTNSFSTLGWPRTSEPWMHQGRTCRENGAASTTVPTPPWINAPGKALNADVIAGSPVQ